MWWRRLRYVVLLIALSAIATCPAAKRSCTAKARSGEADELLDYLAERVTAHVATTGRVPATAAPLTPQPGCCEQGGVCKPDGASWAAAGWRELGFSIDNEYRFSYEYVPDASGLSATVRAVGDVECAETPTTVEVRLTVIGGKVSRVWSRKTAMPAAPPADE